ncbi:integrase zinc binding domain-containing protein, partial [Xanthomonas translucens]|uniref:integrase zinc binding domain-containing protein n=1 Tax=Xanthomonas campestris pv. translucens TaxID=343 RepID=UPI0035E56B78
KLSMILAPALVGELRKMNIEIVELGVTKQLLFTLSAAPSLPEEIWKAQWEDAQLDKLRSLVQHGQDNGFEIHDDGSLRFQGRWCVPKGRQDLKEQIMREAHCTPYSVHPGADKLYKDIRTHYWWAGMKRDVAEFVAKCLTCQKVKLEHKRPMGLLQPLDIPQWK